jgi:hypothetical protein
VGSGWKQLGRLFQPKRSIIDVTRRAAKAGSARDCCGGLDGNNVGVSVVKIEALD